MQLEWEGALREPLWAEKEGVRVPGGGNRERQETDGVHGSGGAGTEHRAWRRLEHSVPTTEPSEYSRAIWGGARILKGNKGRGCRGRS